MWFKAAIVNIFILMDQISMYDVKILPDMEHFSDFQLIV